MWDKNVLVWTVNQRGVVKRNKRQHLCQKTKRQYTD